MDDRARERLEQLLDLLTEAVAERLEAGIEHQFAESASSESAPPSSVPPVEPLAPLAEDGFRQGFALDLAEIDGSPASPLA